MPKAICLPIDIKTEDETGGVVILHDYFKPELPGVKEVVAVFGKECLEKEGHGIARVPVGDGYNIVLLK